MSCIVMESPMLSQTPLCLPTESGQTLPESAQGTVIAWLLCKLYDPYFLIFCLYTCSFHFVSCGMVSHPDRLFIIYLSMHEDFWSCWELIEIMRQFSKSTHLKEKKRLEQSP